MNKKFSYLSVVILALLWHLNSMGQDLHFSQYFNSPLLINPANTGFIPDGEYRLGMNYRTQWASVSGNPYKTFSVFGDGQFFGNRFENGWIGIGGALLRDVAGAGNLTSTRAFGSIAYHQALGLGSLVSGGFNVGWVNKRVDISKLTFDNQWNGKFFDIGAPSGESFAANQTNYFTLQAGLNYAYYPNENTYLNVGFSASNINRPNETFFSPNLVDTRIAMRMTTFINGSFRAGDAWILNPNVYVSKMSTAWEVVGGVNGQRKLNEDGSTQLIMGAYYRVSDALIPMVGFQQSGYKLTFSYDATASTLRNYNQTRGAYEVSVIKQGLIDKSRELKCPGVRF
ncbi:MAG: PorP/SprF family type IX secretion system membrane protein [Bacteroidota bacterium]|nr:PorP/SprF family type IX secretion system membrane protein [Bacteroidota bacterium]